MTKLAFPREKSDTHLPAPPNSYVQLRYRSWLHNSIDAAIEACSTRPQKDHIKDEWKYTAKQWAMYSRQGSSLLLQTRSTMPVEDWHNIGIRKAGAFDTTKFSLSRIGKRIVDAVEECMAEAVQTYGTFRAKKVREFTNMPMLHRFPYPVQTLIHAQLLALEEEPAIQEHFDSEKACVCPFSRKWQLPCRHILKQEKLFGYFFFNPFWERWYSKWETCGFETYESIVPDPISDAAGKDDCLRDRARREAEIGRIVSDIRRKHAEVEAMFADHDPSVQETAAGTWLSHLHMIKHYLGEGPWVFTGPNSPGSNVNGYTLERDAISALNNDYWPMETLWFDD